MRIILVSIAALLCAAPAVLFTPSSDEANPAVTGYELDLVRKSDNVVVQTIAITKGAWTTNTDGTHTVALNVQPIAFATYLSVMRTVAGTLKGIDSPPSNDWDRVPGAPSKVTAK